MSIAEACPSAADTYVATICATQQRIPLTFDKDFGELVFRRGLPAGSGVVLFHITPESPEHAAAVALALVQAGQELIGYFCVVGRDWVRVRPLGPESGS
jgi:predicted nuclease of predicted toxin-antitoxin system